METGEFTQVYCRWVPSERGALVLSLKEKSNGDCIFWASGLSLGGGCSVYEARPLQCRAFPFWQSMLSSWKNWKAAAEGCPGIGRETLHSPGTIKKWLARRQKEPIISKGET